MPIFTRYKLSGEVVESRFIELDELTKYSILGQKARVTTKDGKVYEGFADEPYHTEEGNSLTLMWYDTDYKTGHLRSSNMVTIFIPIGIVAKIEAILYSNPRWGLPPFNEFLFNSEIKRCEFKPDDELKQFIRDFNKKHQK
ncbi:hypothetical protein [Lactobacillus gallinarum]|uniref:hypothetical protein n=1 Tax=Lactobacillus gallinarum TaxID=52242 RepID=UPI001F152936|nr:hypothetical protein [Lactobacillus gallinarum]